MSYIEQKIADELRILPLDKQQEVLAFIERLKEKLTMNPTDSTVQPKKPVLFGEVADKYAGCLDGGPEDLSTNKAYMEGFGKK
jgi:hypothetical protein